jgi:hypothetical protein
MQLIEQQEHINNTCIYYTIYISSRTFTAISTEITPLTNFEYERNMSCRLLISLVNNKNSKHILETGRRKAFL